MPRLRQVVKVKKKSSNVLRMRDFEREKDSIDRTRAHFRSTVEVPFSYPSYTLVSKASLPTCPETCKICAQHYLPGSAVFYTARAMVPHSDTEAAQTAADYVKSINADREDIRTKLKMHGDLLLRRWQRKSIEKRAEVVRTAMPEVHARRFQNAWLLFENKRAFEQHDSSIDKKKVRERGFEHYLAETMRAMQIHNDSHRKQHLLPFIDIETLSQDSMCLLALLHYRSNSEIDDWVMHDFEQLNVGFNWTMGPPAFNPHCVVMYGKHLGRLILWNQQSAHRHDIIGYPKAVLILEAQATLFTFLRKAIEILLEPGLQEATAGHEQWDSLVQSDFGQIDSTSLVHRRLQAFRSPPRLDMAAIVKSLTEQKDIMFDELWLQQTDPQYFRAHLVQAKNSELHDRLTRTWREEWVLNSALCYSVWADNFQTALLQASSVLNMQERLGHEVCAGKSLPTRYEVIVVLFEKHLKQLFEGQLHDLRCLWPQEKSFQAHFNFLEGGEPKLNKSPEKLFLANPMLWNMKQLTDKSESQSPTFHLAFIDHLMHEDARNEKSRISPLLATHISSMIIVDDILASLRFQRPQQGVSADAGMLARFESEQPRTLPARQQAALGRLYNLKDAMWPKLQACMKLPLPPSDEPAVLLKHLGPLDKAMQEFWDSACACFMLAIKYSSHPPELYANPTYLTVIGTSVKEQERRALRYAALERAAAEQETRKQLQAIEASSRTSAVAPPLQTTWGEPAVAFPLIEKGSKVKTKTRPSNPPTSSTDDETWEAELVASPPSPQASSILVSSKRLTLFERMFTADPETPGEIYWTDFVSAMADAGCSVMPGGGSCFTFTHLDEKGQKHSMVFHRPHPEPSMSKERLKSFGSRLNRRWGWSEATFAMKNG